jgi:hypothetical protein
MRWIGVVLAAGLVVSGYVLVFRGLDEHMQLQAEINAKLPQSEKFEPTFWWLGTYLKFRSLREQFLPGDQRWKKSSILSFAGLGLVITGIILGASMLPAL